MTRYLLAFAATAFALIALGFGQRAAAPVALPPDAAWQSELTSHDGTYVVRCRIEPEDFEVGDMFELRVEVRRADGEALDAQLAVDARMPEHGHGMNREPIIARGDGGGFTAENLLFHMPGYWEVYLDLTRGAVTERTQFSLDLE